MASRTWLKNSGADVRSDDWHRGTRGRSEDAWPSPSQVGEDEVLRNDSLRLADKARAAGVSVTLERYAGLWHVFQAHVGMLRAADRAMQSVLKFLKAQGA